MPGALRQPPFDAIAEYSDCSVAITVRCYDLAGRLIWRAPGVVCIACGEVLLRGELVDGKCDECAHAAMACARCGATGLPVHSTFTTLYGEVCRECIEDLEREPSEPSCAWCRDIGCTQCLTDVERR